MQYSILLSDLQNDSEEDCDTERDQSAELHSHFKKFEIRFRNESKDEVLKKHTVKF